MSQKPVTINGREYDPHTGVPILRDDIRPSKQRAGGVRELHSAGQIHTRMQRSQTLNRRYVHSHLQQKLAAKSAKQAAATEQVIAVKKVAKQPVAVAEHPALQHTISRFGRPALAPTPIPVMSEQPGRAQPIPDIAPGIHPMVQRAEAIRAEREPATQAKTMPKPSDILKAEAIQKAMDDAPTGTKRRRERAPKQPAKRSLFARMSAFASAGAALLLLGGYFTYLNMPNLSVRVAAAQAGIDATYPGYKPSGYSLSGPVAYDSGQVRMKFAANGGPQSFTLNQERTGWDSSAVLENYVEPIAKSDFYVAKDSGLTIYTFGNHAAWVNNGILHTIDGDATLSEDQVRRIATSM